MTARQQIQSWLVVAAAAIVLLYLLRTIMLPFVAGIGIAYLLDPIVDRLQRYRLSRTLATSVIIGGFLLILIAGLLVILPVAQAQIVGFLGRLPDYSEALRDLLQRVVEAVQARVADEQLQQIRSAASQYLGRAADWVLTVLREIWSGGTAFLNLLSLVFIMPIVAFYLLRDWDDITARVDSWLPRDHADDIRTILSEIDMRLAGFIRGQLMVAVILAAIYALGLSALGLEFGLIIGLAAGVASLVPFVGAIAGFAMAMLVALFQFTGDWLMVALVAGVFIAGQALEGNFLTPRLVGARIGLHPVWVIFAVLAGGVLFGFVGVLLAVPAAAVVGVLVRAALARYQRSRLYLGTDGEGTSDDS